MTITLWSLLQIMKEFMSHDTMMLISQLSMSEVQLMLKKGRSAKPDDKELEIIQDTLIFAEKICHQVDLPNAYVKVAMANMHLREFNNKASYSSLASDIRHVQDMITHDLVNRKFIEVSPEYSDFVNNDAPFGKEVAEAFPSAKEDIREAGNCIAVGLGTAAVFHLMRAVEWGLRALCIHLGVTRVRRSNKPGDQKYMAVSWATWERILDEVQKKIDQKIERLGRGKKKQELQQFYYPLMQDLKGFKDAFRNHVMHGREAFSLKRASDIHDYVGRFMQSLAIKVSE